MSQHDELLSTIKHTRHDWLNTIQLIKGNLALGHYKRIEEIIEQITQKSISESKLCNIHAPELSLFLIGYNWTSQKVDMNYEVIGEVKSLKDWAEPLYLLVRAIMDHLDRSSSFTSENSVMITFNFVEEICSLTFRFVGKTELKEADWQGIINRTTDSGLKGSLLHQDRYECVFTILIKEA
ncbi:Spo0B domain-containing protein [Alkalicoccobacillus plakortidis]|uniref:Sporulation initiation phosphotransferase B n=1 Tax=Alkalicoccobacillus plakortidis TaxID=444060 RepID=A0ABT0XL71_9BACI|nr:Spo0B domain-containing protein [Alkalicoccobacillus plakortidis]MCM2676655.1 sporulation initiation phosphotransferase B [Alkalicoccobacillus plakortidis]